jgi:hypothetical protein
MYGACLGPLYAASLEIGLWAHPDVNDQLFGTQGGPVNVIVFALDGRIMAYQEKPPERDPATRRTRGKLLGSGSDVAFFEVP